MKETKVKKWNYGNYSSNNYGVNCMAVSIGDFDFYFSYDTVIAFETRSEFFICKNEWGNTTGKHLNWIDPDKSKRIPHHEFETKLNDVLKRHKITLS